MTFNVGIRRGEKWNYDPWGSDDNEHTFNITVEQWVSIRYIEQEWRLQSIIAEQ